MSKASFSGSRVLMKYSGKLKPMCCRMQSGTRDLSCPHGLDRIKRELEARNHPQFFPAPRRSVWPCLTFGPCLEPCNVATEPLRLRVGERHCHLSCDRPYVDRHRESEAALTVV